MLVRLPAALESQMQSETGLTAMDYYVLALLSDVHARRTQSVFAIQPS